METMNTGEVVETTDPKSNERTEVGSGQGESPCGTGDSDADTAKVTVHKLSAECPTHGNVPVVCPRCAGKAGGKAHRGTRSRRKKELKALADARRVLDISTEAKMLEDLASERKEFQDLADKMKWTKDERELVFTEIHLDQGISHLRELADRMGMSPDERAKLLTDMQKMVALALSSPDEAIALLELHGRKE